MTSPPQPGDTTPPVSPTPSGPQSPPGTGPSGPTAATWTAPVPADPPSLPGSTPGLTWFRLHDHTTVLDLPLHAPDATRAWAATMWPDTRIAGGWQRQFWQPGPAGRGFVPAVLELGDVVQFGIEHAAPLGTQASTPARVTTWHGYLHAVRGDSVLVHGPHPAPHQALAAAQQALVEQIHHSARIAAETAHQNGRSTHLGAPDRTAAITPAQPPASVTVAFHDAEATVGDPTHGWLVVPTAQLMSAMTRPATELTQLLTGRVYLTGREPPLTLAALAARHASEHLPNPATAPRPPAAATPSHVGPQPPAATGPGTGNPPAPSATPPEASL